MRSSSLMIALGLAAVSLNAIGERTPARAPALAPSAADARVVVKFKADASVTRAHALSAQPSAADATRVLGARAAALGGRHGLLLHAGAATGERVQIVRADAAHGLDGRALAARLAADPDVEYAEPVRRARRLAVPNDPLFTTVAGSQGPTSGQWYLRAPAGEVQSAINAVAAWDVHTGNRDVLVAVLDTGVRRNHPDLSGKLVGGYDFISDSRVANDSSGRDSDPSDPGDWLTQTEIDANPTLWSGCEVSGSSWHGTQVSGIVAAATDNGVGMAGSGRHVRVVPVRVLGKCFGETPDINAAIRWAAGATVAGVPANPNPAKVINLSLGTGGACSADDQDAVNAAIQRGAVVVAAAGNSAGRAAGSPANCQGVIGVAGVRHFGTKVGFSDIGPEVKIAAPGGNCVLIGDNDPCLYPILTTLDSGTRGPAASAYSDSFNASVGTSFAAPLVAGTAALLYSVKSDITPGQVLSTLQSTARAFPSSGAAPDPITGPIQQCQAPGNFDQLQCYCTTTTCGAGMLDANAAVRALLGGSALQPVATVQTAAPQAGQSVALTSGASVVPAGRSIAARQWRLVDSGGIVTGFGGAADETTTSLTPSAAGRFVVQLTLIDERGVATSSDVAVTVAAAPGGGDPPPPPVDGGGGGGGGGGLSAGWLLGLGLAAAALARRRGAAQALCAAGVAMLAAAPTGSWAADRAEPVRGLVVQLRDAPSHALVARGRAQALAAGGETAGAAVRAEALRWQRVLAASAAAASRIAERRAVGESAQLLRFDRAVTPAEAQALAEQLMRSGEVAWAVPQTRERRLQAAGGPPTDPLYASQWWLQLAGLGSGGAPEYLRVWTSVTTGSADAVVAVLDSGIVGHPDLDGKVIAGYDLVADSGYSNDGDGRDANPADPGDWVDTDDVRRDPGRYQGCETGSSSWHGTAIAGMLAAQTNNGAGGASMNWPGRVLAVRVATKCGADVTDIADGIRWVAGLAVCLRHDGAGTCLETSPEVASPRARIVNISFGGSGECAPIYQEAIDAARSRGVVIVAASGNEHASPTRPAKCSGVIGVAALNREGFKTTYSNFGSALAIATVGGDDADGAWSALADSGMTSVANTGSTGPGASDYANYYGTSFSTPIVSGAVGLMLAVNPALTPAQVEQGLRRSARPHVTSPLMQACSDANPGRCLCTTRTCGAGILDVPRALAYAANPSGYVATPLPVLSIDTPALRAVAAAGPDRPANAGSGGGGDGGGGGAMSAAWLLALGAAAGALRRRTARR